MKKIILSLIFCAISLNCMSAMISVSTNSCGEQNGQSCTNKEEGILEGIWKEQNSNCVCVPSLCYEDYAFYDSKCYEKIKVVECETCNSQLTNAKECAQKWDENKYGECYPTKCDESKAHLEENTCVANIQGCECDAVPYGSVCEQRWEGESFGECYPTECVSGFYTVDKSCKEKVCENGETSSCINDIDKSQEAIKKCMNNTWGTCTLKKCQKYYHTNENTCVFNYKKYEL